MRAKLLQANALSIPLADKSVQTCVTSPPYYGLRDYGTAEWVGGDETCNHNPQKPDGGDRADRSLPLGRDGMYKDICGKCGAERVDAQIGLEQTLAEYIENLCLVFDEVWRVLRDDGTVWLNLGDSYAGSWGNSGHRPELDGGEGTQREKKTEYLSRGGYKDHRSTPPTANAKGFKPKDLMGVPWSVAKALQAPRYLGKIKNELDRVWLAAMLDTEGCLYIHKRKAGQHAGDGYHRKQDSYGAGIEVANTHRQIAERCLQITGLGSISIQTKGRRQPIYRWHVRTDQAKQLIEEVYPYMVAKQHQARILYAVPSSGEKAVEYHQALMDLHNGISVEVDADAPKLLYRQGWYLRSDVIWVKPNPMPESVTDRPTKAHEYIFLLTKAKRYYYDADAIREKAAYDGRHDTMMKGSEKYNAPVVPGQDAHTFALRGHERWPNKTADGSRGRNKRTVWTVTTKPYKGAHFATFPPDLIEPCILAGTSEKGQCPECGAPWERVVEKSRENQSYWGKSGKTPKDVIDIGKYGNKNLHDGSEHFDRKRQEHDIRLGPTVSTKTTGWRQTCEHDHEPVPHIVLDPFGGSGTTAQVSQAHGRTGVCLDLSWEYLQLARERCGLKQMADWETGKQVESNWEDMPLFNT